MLLRDSTWVKIRDQFTEEEIEAIKAVIRSKRCCPPGYHLREEGMDLALAAKLRDLILRMS
jgi:hypothetical protein